MKTFMKILMILLSLFMIYIAATTSLESNLFEELPNLLEIPWMKATLWDFYINILLIYLWLLFKEPRWIWRIIWLLLFVCLGSIATAFFVFLQIQQLPPNAPLSDLFAKPGVLKNDA